MTRYDVRPDDISGHGKEVDGFSTRLSTASSAGETTLSTEAFGLMNTGLALIGVGFATAMQHGVSGLSKDMKETMVALESTVKRYSSDDDFATVSIQRAGGTS